MTRPGQAGVEDVAESIKDGRGPATLEAIEDAAERLDPGSAEEQASTSKALFGAAESGARRRLGLPEGGVAPASTVPAPEAPEPPSPDEPYRRAVWYARCHGHPCALDLDGTPDPAQRVVGRLALRLAVAEQDAAHRAGRLRRLLGLFLADLGDPRNTLPHLGLDAAASGAHLEEVVHAARQVAVLREELARAARDLRPLPDPSEHGAADGAEYGKEPG
jgi:hypothetical protein